MNDYFWEVLTRLTKQGLKARFLARPDACPACRKLHGRIFDPLEAPPIPVKECLTPACRCRYEGCDPTAAVARLLRAGMAAVNEQRLEEARELLYQVIAIDDQNDKAWLWLSGAAEGLEERITCLVNVLAIDPDHEWAREGLTYLLAQRKEVGPGQVAARKIKEAREAIGRIRATPERISTLREREPVPATPVRQRMARRHVPQRALEAERIPIKAIVIAFLCGLFAVLILVLVLAALTYTGIL